VLPLKDLWGPSVGEKVTIEDGKISMGLEGLPVGRAWVAGTLLRQGWGEQAESGADYTNSYCILVQLVKDYFKWFGWREEAGWVVKTGLGKSQKREINAYKTSHHLTNYQKMSRLSSTSRLRPRLPGVMGHLRTEKSEAAPRDQNEGTPR
jgi:hypothetical protein